LGGLSGGKIMRDMQYAAKKFSAPASWHTSQMTWDAAFLTKKEFIAKYSKTAYFLASASQEELDEALKHDA
jgi:hypothetical protein